MKKQGITWSAKKIINVLYGFIGGYMILVMLVLASMMFV